MLLLVPMKHSVRTARAGIALLVALALAAGCTAPATDDAAEPAVTGADETAAAIASAETLIGLEFTPDERALMVGEVENHREAYRGLRAVRLPNAVPPQFTLDADGEACAAPASAPGSPTPRHVRTISKRSRS
jgi:hypothetical protein